MMAAGNLQNPPFEVRGLRGELRFNEPMHKHTSWRVGGLADYFYVPADREDVVQLIQRVPAEMPICWVGLGSNLLVRDAGVAGLVIKTPKALSTLNVNSDGKVYAEVGVSCAKIARVTVEKGFSGAEFLAGVPGSFGGALAMNAGAFGGETWPLIKSVDGIDRAGNCRTFAAAQVDFAYRTVTLPDGYWLLSGVMQLEQAEKNSDGKKKIKSLLEKRSASQPIQSANAGSVFKNPKGDFAARIIESLGLKGVSAGGARFSEVHANFIINEGSASASDIEELISIAIESAQNRLGIRLEPEVRIIGRQLR